MIGISYWGTDIYHMYFVFMYYHHCSHHPTPWPMGGDASGCVAPFFTSPHLIHFIQEMLSFVPCFSTCEDTVPAQAFSWGGFANFSWVFFVLFLAYIGGNKVG